jgi:hypothetical protein
MIGRQDSVVDFGGDGPGHRDRPADANATFSGTHGTADHETPRVGQRNVTRMPSVFGIAG